MQEAHKQPPTAVITQGQLSKTTSWMELGEARHAQEALDHNQDSDDPLPLECEEAAFIVVLTLDMAPHAHPPRQNRHTLRVQRNLQSPHGNRG